MKKALRIIVIFLLLFATVIGCTACMQSGEIMIDGVVYRETNGKYSVRDITRWAGSRVVIPSEIDGKPVVSLNDRGEWILPNRSREIILPDTIESINQNFYESASPQLRYNEYGNALYLGTEDNPYFALIRAKEVDLPDQMSYRLDVNTGELETPATPPFVSNFSDIYTCEIHPDTKIIAENAFSGCVNLKSVVVHGGIKVIPDYVFAGCISLETVVIEEGVEVISSTAFESCYSVENFTLPSTVKESTTLCMNMKSLKSMAIPEGWTSIPSYMFYGCESLEYITIPSTVKSIGEMAFYGCKSLVQITMPEGLTDIDTWAFADCTSLTYIYIPNGVTSIGEGAFNNASSLTAIKIPVNLFLRAEHDIFYGAPITDFDIDYSKTLTVGVDGSLYDTEMKTLIRYEGDPSIKTFTVPSTVKYIAECAFENSSLETIILPEGLTHIGMAAFRNCDSLVSISLPSRVEYIGDFTFADCDALESFSFPQRMHTYRYSGIFDSCDSLREISFTATYIDGLSKSMFEDCPTLESINFSSDTNRRYYSVDGVLYSYTGHSQLIYYPNGKQDKKFILPSNVSYINEGAFRGNKYLESIKLNSSLVKICTEAFKDCISLKEIIIPDSVTYIEERAFEGCTSLEKAVLGNGITAISEDIFRNCSSLKNVDLGNRLMFIFPGAFLGCYELEKVTLPHYCMNILGVVFEDRVQLYYDGTVSECSWESKSWKQIKANSKEGFYIICSDGEFLFKK